MVSIARALALDAQAAAPGRADRGAVAADGAIDRRRYRLNSPNFGHAVLIAESNLHHVPDFADRLYVMERGKMIFSGPPANARKDRPLPKIVEGV